MTKKWIFINLLLLLIACLVAWQLLVSVREFKTENDLTRIQPVRDMKQQLAKESILSPLERPQTYFPAEFAIIPENNIFSDSRSQKEDESAVPALPESPMLMQKPILVGIHISGNQRMASIIDSQNSSRNQNRRSETKRIGDVYQGYTITAINSDHIVLESGSRREIIPLHEGSKRPQGGKTQILSTRVVSFGGDTVSGGAPIKVATTSARATRNSSTTAATPANVATSQRQQSTAKQAATAKVAQTPADRPPARQQEPQQQAPTTGTESPERQVIRTPFGNIVRPARR